LKKMAAGRVFPLAVSLGQVSRPLRQHPPPTSLALSSSFLFLGPAKGTCFKMAVGRLLLVVVSLGVAVLAQVSSP
jgi:hypothetical protein